MKICFVTSPGGHIYQSYILKKWWKDHQRFWVSLPSPDVTQLMKNERAYYAFGPENRNVGNAIRNFFFALKILKAEKPDLVFSTGAGLAPPFFLAAKILHIETIFLEPYDFIDSLSMSAQFVRPLTSHLLVQHKNLIKKYPKTKFWGSII